MKEFMLAYIEAVHDFKRNKETALAVLKKYTRNDDREVLEDSYSNIASKYLTMLIPTLEYPDDSDGPFKHSASGEERRPGTIRLAQDRQRDRSERFR